MTTTSPTTSPTTALSPVPRPPLVNPTYLRLELRRMLRNRRTLVFSVILPVAFLLSFGLPQSDKQAFGYVAVDFAVYGAMIAATVTGAAVSVERSTGWSRQLRLTPLTPAAHITTKVVGALVLAVLPVVVVLGAAAALGAQLSGGEWANAALVAWLGAVPFAALGLTVGYLVPSENAMQLVGGLMSLLAMLGGLFVPLSVFGHAMRTVASLTPAYGTGVLARYPFAHEASIAAGVTSVLVWTAVFVAGAALLFRRDTARV